MKKYVVYTEILKEEGIERWYYGTYTRERANEVALQLGNEYPIYHCVIEAEEAVEFGIKNLPADLL